MKLLWHLLSTDVRRFRLLIVIWVLTIVGWTLLEGSGPRFADDALMVQPLGLASDLVWLATLIVTAVGVPLIVQAHPLVGSDAFWTTRPIPPRTLLVSKTILLVLLVVVVPLVCELALMAAYHMRPGAIAAVALQTLLWKMLLLVCLMTAAAVTRSVPHFALLCGAAILSVAIVLSMLVLIAVSKMRDSAREATFVAVSGSVPSPATDETSTVVFAVLAIAAGAVLLTLLYRTRSRLRSVPVGAGGAVVAGVIAAFWPWPLLQSPLRAPAWADAPSALRLNADPDSVRFDRQNDWFDEAQGRRIGRAQIRLADHEPGWLAAVRVLDATLEIDRDVRLSSPGLGSSAIMPIDGRDNSQQRIVLSDLLRVERLAMFEPSPGDTDAVVLLVRSEDFNRHAAAVGRYRGRVLVDLTRKEEVASLPLRAGATFQDSVYRLAIDDVRPSPHAVSIRARVCTALSIFDRQPSSMYSFYLRNRRRGEATAGHDMPIESAFFLSRFTSGLSVGSNSPGFRVNEHRLRFPEGFLPEKQSIDIDHTWLEDAELVIVRDTPAGSVPRTVEIPRFQLREAEPARSSGR